MTNMNQSDKLVILWTSRDREVAERMVFMYTLNAKLREWWKDLTLIIWGPSAQLAAEDEDLQHYLKKILEAGVEVIACKACADSYGVSEDLARLRIDVKYMGEPLTEYVKDGYKVLAF